MIPAFVKNRRGDTYINQLVYSVKGGLLSAPANQNPLNIDAASSATNPGLTAQAVMESSLEAVTEVYSAIGEFEAFATGLFTGTSGSAAITGTGTRFSTELANGDQIILDPFGATPVTVTVSSVTNATSMTLSAPLSANYTGVVAKLVTNADKVIKSGRLQIYDVVNRRRLMNAPIVLEHIFGTVGKPFYMAEALLLRAQQALQFDFQNKSPLGYIKARYAFEMRKFQQDAMRNPSVSNWLAKQMQRKRSLYPYWLTADPTSSNDPIQIPAGGSIDVFFTPDRNLEMVCYQIIENSSTTGTAGNTSDRYTFEIFDAATERPLQNQPIARPSGTGTAQFPFNLPTALLLEANTKLRVRFNNLVTDAVTNVNMTFHGVANTVDVH